MAPADHPSERTAAGMQYIIPGTERNVIRKPSARPLTRDGEQFVLPGAEKMSVGELLSRRDQLPLRPRRAQLSLNGTSLFGASRR